MLAHSSVALPSVSSSGAATSLAKKRVRKCTLRACNTIIYANILDTMGFGISPTIAFPHVLVFELALCISYMYMCHHSLSAAPLPTFVLGPQSTEHAQFFEKLGPDGGELCENITCLGRQKTMSTQSFICQVAQPCVHVQHMILCILTIGS